MHLRVSELWLPVFPVLEVLEGGSPLAGTHQSNPHLIPFAAFCQILKNILRMRRYAANGMQINDVIMLSLGPPTQSPAALLSASRRPSLFPVDEASDFDFLSAWLSQCGSFRSSHRNVFNLSPAETVCNVLFQLGESILDERFSALQVSCLLLLQFLSAEVRNRHV